MTSGIPAFGTSIQHSDLAFLLQDQLNGMGDYLTQEVGSLNWIESLIWARALNACKQYITLLANQLSPASASIFLERWAAIYNALGLNNPVSIQQYIELKQSQFGTPPILSNINSFFQQQLGEIFIELQWTPELQPLATTDPINQISVDGYAYSAPLCNVLVYVWQPRDNQDNLLVPNSLFNTTVESYHQIIESWNPAYISFITMNLQNRGNQDGYGGGYNGLNYNNYLDGYNVVSGTTGTTTISGTNTTFLSYPGGEPGDFIEAVSEGYFPPIQIVDDSNQLHTYYVSRVLSNNILTITTPLKNNITNRTYRCLGLVLDTPGMLDFGMLANNT